MAIDLHFMEKKKETRGRKKNTAKGKQVKISKGVYMYPSQLAKINKEYGSLAAYWQKCLTADNIN